MSESTTAAQGNRSDTAKSLKKALRILECVALYPNGATVKQISETLLMNKPLISKNLAVFEEMEYVIRDPGTHTFRLGTKLLYLSHKMTSSLDLYSMARPFMAELNRQTEETVNLALYNATAHNLVYIGTIDGNHKLRLTNAVGTSPVLTSSAVGKALMAFLPRGELAQVLESNSILPRTRFSISSQNELDEQLDITRKRGYAISDEETIEGVLGIAAPIYGVDEQIIGTIAVTGPKMRFPDHIIRRYGALVMRAARDISRQMGCLDA